MSTLSRIACAAACGWAVIMGSPAVAADLPPPPVVVPPPPAVGGWYLRGDIAYKIYAEPTADWDDSIAGLPFDDEDLDDTFGIGVGVGYRFNGWLRADVTADYEFPADFSATTPCPAPCGGLGVAGTNVEVGELSAVPILANVYVDLGNWRGLSPYIGAGAGVAYVMMDDIQSLQADGTVVDWGDGDDWNFAWALMAGLAYDFTPNMALDIGYRYLNLGEVSSGTIPFGAGDGDFTYDDLQAHEIRVGLRYTLF